MAQFMDDNRKKKEESGKQSPCLKIFRSALASLEAVFILG